MRLVAFALWLVPAALAAQTTASITGSVRAQSGAPVAGARVTFDPGGPAGETDVQGRFRLVVPAAMAGTIRFAAVGFSPEAVPVARLAAGGSRQIAVTLVPLYTLDALTVIAQPERPLLNTESATTGGAVEQAELEALPTDQRDPITLLFNIPGIAQSTGFFGDAPVLSINGANS
ncbi:MAG TPA: carboxypeptidase-like regulatory domain-containing protein, partial [Gemmatimonadales bacterium]|nr:carboxypeptidase-like regulatory domain-containing protein [Gemmatimonadales bacterium]